MYQAELARTGKPLFVIRGAYIYFPVIGAGLIPYLTGRFGPFEDATANCVWWWLGVFIGSLGAFIRIITSGHAANGTSSKPKLAAEAAELNTTGPYSLVRNPLYVGRILNYTGMAMLSGSWVFAVLTYLISVLIYERVAVYEEEFLRGKFGEAHAKWAERVPFLLPKLSGWVKPKYAFWWKRMVWREQHKLFLLATAIFLSWFARYGFDINAVPPDQMIWIHVAIVIVVVRLAIGASAGLGFFKGIK